MKKEDFESYCEEQMGMQIPQGVFQNTFEKEVFITLNILRLQPEIVLKNLKEVRKRLKIPKKKYKE